PSIGPGSKARSLRRCWTRSTSSPWTPFDRVRSSGTLGTLLSVVDTGSVVAGAAVLVVVRRGSTSVSSPTEVDVEPAPAPLEPSPRLAATPAPTTATPATTATTAGVQRPAPPLSTATGLPR